MVRGRAEQQRFSAHDAPDAMETPGCSPFLGQITHTGFPLDSGLPSFGDEYLTARCWYTRVHECKIHLYMSSHQTGA